MNFEALRNMDTFTDAMFNRIIAFQEKEHPAWREELPFDLRIQGLPLHNLIFSNPDRDPARYGPTVAPYYPLREEMLKIANYAQRVAAQPLVCDLHAGNGFIGSLLAREGVQVIGLRDPQAKPYQIKNFYDAGHYTLKEMRLDDINFPFDVAFSSWMPSGQNLTPNIIRHHPKLIVYIHSMHLNEATGLYQTGTLEAFEHLPVNYKLVDEWMVTRPANLLHEIWPDLTPNIEETRYVKIYAEVAYADLLIHAPAPRTDVPGYDWEAELDMALLAHEAKQSLRARGIPV